VGLFDRKQGGKVSKQMVGHPCLHRQLLQNTRMLGALPHNNSFLKYFSDFFIIIIVRWTSVVLNGGHAVVTSGTNRDFPSSKVAQNRARSNWPVDFGLNDHVFCVHHSSQLWLDFNVGSTPVRSSDKIMEWF
jgi:hypothetical protein